MTNAQRARRYLQASVKAGLTGLPAEHREAYEQQMREHERAYKHVRKHALAGTTADFDKPLSAGEREHQAHLREREGLTMADVHRMRKEIREPEPDKPAGKSGNEDTSSFGGRLSDEAKATRDLIPGLPSSSSGGIEYGIYVGLALVLVYLLVNKGGAGTLGKLGGWLTGAARSWVSPTDPLASGSTVQEVTGGVDVATAAEPSSTSTGSSSAPSSTPAPAGGPPSSPQWAGLVQGKLTFAGYDQGIDFTGAGGVRAIANGKITRLQTTGSGWPGGALLAYTITSGPDKGRDVYLAEAFTPTSDLKVGDEIRQGQVIATVNSSYPGIEYGFAQNPEGQAYGSPKQGHGEPPNPQSYAFGRLAQAAANPHAGARRRAGTRRLTTARRVG